MGQGLKQGFAEIVMRSPGRYEISFLHLVPQNDVHEMQTCQDHMNPEHCSSSCVKSDAGLSGLSSREVQHGQ